MSTFDWELSSHYTVTSGRYQKLRESSVILTNNKPAIESQYVKKHLGKILSQCLAEICERRPHDPIEYIAQWIYKHRENEIRKMKEAAELEELIHEQEEKLREDDMLDLGRPDAPIPSSRYKISTSSITSATKVERDSSQNLNKQKSDPAPEVHGGKSDSSLKQKSDPNITVEASPPPNQTGSTPNILIAPPTAAPSVVDQTLSNNSMLSDGSATNYIQNSTLDQSNYM